MSEHDARDSRGADDVFIADPEAFVDDLADRELPGWTKPVGVISIIWGVLTLLCGGVGTAWQAMIAPRMLGGLEGGAPPSLVNPPTLLIALTIIGVVWSVQLIVAGVFTVSRNPFGRPLHLVYAIGGIVLSAVSIKLNLDIQLEAMQWVKDNPDSQFAKVQGQGGAGGAIGVVVGVVLGFAWPVFCLFWFGLIKRKPDDFTGGVERVA